MYSNFDITNIMMILFSYQIQDNVGKIFLIAS